MGHATFLDMAPCSFRSNTPPHQDQLARRGNGGLAPIILMSRTGHADLRRALYMPGLVARRYNPALKIFGDRLSATGLTPKAVVGAVMRKLAHLIYGGIKSGQPFNLNLAVPRVDFEDGILPCDWIMR